MQGVKKQRAGASKADELVLATLNTDGSRRWLKPKLSPGRFLTSRRTVAWLLIAIFTAIPYIQINNKPSILLDLVHRRFTFFGTTFLPTDTLLLALLFLIIFLSIFLITAMFGRVWCGWACPQTVYMEFLYRPIERFFDGAPGSPRANRPPNPARKLLKYAVFFVCSCFLAHTFLAYFVGIEQLRHWIMRSPTEHPTGFLVMAAVTGLMMFDFSYFREQTCLVACPYGRLQSAMLDKHTLIVSYNRKRGEPRGKLQKHDADVHLNVVTEAPVHGDCIDCHKCVVTCPTGIDIREGLQMECIGCAQCIDACDSVMDKIGKPRGLIGYASRAIHEGQARSILRPRVVLYPTIILGLIGLFLYVLLTKSTGEAQILPRQSTPFYTLDTGEIGNQVRVRLANRTDEPSTFTLSIPPKDAARGAKLLTDINPITLKGGETLVVGCILSVPKESFSDHGLFETELQITDGREFTRKLPYRMLGPVHRTTTPGNANHQSSSP